MDRRWDELRDAIESSDADRTNDAIDDVGGLGAAERLRLLETGFDDLTRIYAESDDGYVRQSVVRVLKESVPGVVAEFLIADGALSAEEIERRTDESCGFLLEALEDDDGRVRRAAVRTLKDVYRTYDALGDEETIRALVAELESMADAVPPDQRKHVRESKDDAEFFLQSGIDRIASGLDRMRERSRKR